MTAKLLLSVAATGLMLTISPAAVQNNQQEKPLDSKVIVAVVGAVGGCLGAVFGAFFTAYFTASKERKIESERETRLAVADVTTKIAALAHSVMWFTYGVKFGGVQGKMRKEFDTEVHAIIAELVGAQYRLAALDLALYKRVTPLVSKGIDLTEKATQAVSEYETQECNTEALQLIKSLPKTIGGLMGPTGAVSSS